MQKPEPTLRTAVEDDSPAIRKLIFGILREYGLSPDPVETDSDLFDLETHYRVGWFCVMNQGATIIGTVALLPMEDDTWELRKMYLHTNWRGRGYGLILLDQAIAKARVLGARRLILSTASVLKEAIKLYKSRGFTPSSETPVAARCDQVWELDLQQSHTSN